MVAVVVCNKQAFMIHICKMGYREEKLNSILPVILNARISSVLMLVDEMGLDRKKEGKRGG